MKIKLILFFLLITIGLGAQETEAVHILFNQNESSSCIHTVSQNPLKKIKLDYIQKRHRKVNITRFILCRNLFVFQFMKDPFETLENTKAATLKTITIPEILEAVEKAEFKKNINELFPNLYIIEKLDDTQWAKYKVIWEKTI